jgi:UDP-glucose:(heptosyl)LPS alpha-1,3-glucosyltransferase
MAPFALSSHNLIKPTMKVALVHMRHAGTGGTERYMNQLSAFLAERGHDVTVICRSHEEPSHPSIRFVKLRSIAIGNAWRMWSFARDVERHVAIGSYDVVYGLGKTWTHDVFRMGGGCQESYLKLAHAATQSWLERAIGPGPKPRLALKLEKKSLAPGAYRRIITNSIWVKQDVMRLHQIPEEKVSVVYNGVDLERFHPDKYRSAGSELRRQYGLPENGYVVLFLGTNYGRKGLDRVLRIFPRFTASSPGARLLVVGYDSARPRFEAMAKKHGIGDVVTFVGGTRKPEEWFSAADLYVIPTRFDPFANSTLEALATGLPVITTKTNGGGELLTEGETGSVITTDEELLQAIKFWRSRTDKDDIRRVTRALAERYPMQLTAQLSSQILEQVVEEKRKKSLI